MTWKLISLAQCAECSGLSWSEILPGALLSARHHSLYASYLLLIRRGAEAVRNMIVADIRSALDLGASRRAADLLIVLRWFLSNHPDACLDPLEKRGTPGSSTRTALSDKGDAANDR